MPPVNASRYLGIVAQSVGERCLAEAAGPAHRRGDGDRLALGVEELALDRAEFGRVAGRSLPPERPP